MERFNPETKSFNRISTGLSASTSKFMDHTADERGTTYKYRLVIAQKAGDKIISNVVDCLYKGPKIIPQPTNLKTKIFTKAGKTFVTMAWNEVPGITKYRVYSDTRDKGIMLEKPMPAAKNVYTFEIFGTGGRDYKFEVASDNNRGKYSKRSAVNVYIPYRQLPDITEFCATIEKDLNVHLKWSTPLYKDLIGFRLYMSVNGKQILVADENELTAKVRSWIVDKPQSYKPKENVAYFNLQAVGKLDAVTKMPKSCNVGLSILKKYDKSIPAPRALNVYKKKNKKGESIIYSSWRRVSLKGWGYSGYGIDAWYTHKGKNSALRLDSSGSPGKPLKAHEYSFEIPKDIERGDTIRIYVYAFGENGKKGLYETKTYTHF